MDSECDLQKYYVMSNTIERRATFSWFASSAVKIQRWRRRSHNKHLGSSQSTDHLGPEHLKGRDLTDFSITRGTPDTPRRRLVLSPRSAVIGETEVLQNGRKVNRSPMNSSPNSRLNSSCCYSESFTSTSSCTERRQDLYDYDTNTSHDSDDSVFYDTVSQSLNYDQGTYLRRQTVSVGTSSNENGTPIWRTNRKHASDSGKRVKRHRISRPRKANSLNGPRDIDSGR